MTEITISRSTARRVVAVVIMFVPLAAILGSFALWRDRLPPELASHWSGTGPADDVMAVAQFLTLAVALTGSAAVASVVLGVWPGLLASTRRYGFLIAGLPAGIGAQTWLVSAYLTMQAGDPYEVVQGPWLILGFVSYVYGLIPFLILPKSRLTSSDVAERITLGPDEGGAWSRVVTARLFLWVAVALTASGIVFFWIAAAANDIADSAVVLVAIAVTVVVLLSLSRYRVTADWRGLRVVSALLRVPLKRIRLDEIDTVDAAEITPKEWGGWGYRVLPGKSALILRTGPGLVVTTVGGNQFAITVDDPGVPAALLATLRDQRRATALSAPSSEFEQD
ncbi:hypothetical protein I6E81_07345 [Salinibacterium sp. NG22]|uniref:hypothetical protein n=1 Tax=Salinibacterium sp. NG22 TaxID=2792040 RepID=UPI0018CE0521|nr:hypothetical protein [Salinibacterium sp. NG22]MBH0109978.1 hypothetical protein [Salinibacterium sp. NG22]